MNWSAKWLIDHREGNKPSFSSDLRIRLLRPPMTVVRRSNPARPSNSWQREVIMKIYHLGVAVGAITGNAAAMDKWKRKNKKKFENLNTRNHFCCSRTSKLRVQTVTKGWGWNSCCPGNLLLGRLQDSNSQDWRRIGCPHCRRRTGKGHDLLHWTRRP